MNGFRTLHGGLLPGQAQLALAWLRAEAAGDDGEIGIIGACILVVAFAGAAALLAAAVTGKLHSWISQIPG